MRNPLLPVLLAGFLGLGGTARAAESGFIYQPELSRITIVVHATVDSFEGTLEACDPVVTLDESGRIVAARLRFKFNDVKTGKPKRDSAMHEWQDTPHFPDGEFVLTSLETVPGAAWLAQGTLTLHGQAHALAFPVSINSTAAACVVDGEVVLDTRDYGLPVIRLLGLLKVDPLVKVRFHLQGKREVRG